MKGAVQLGLDGEVAVVGSRPPDDFYSTPGWLVEAALDAVGLPHLCGSVLDAGAGDGRLGRAVLRRAPGATLYAVELDPARGWLALGVEWVTADFLSWASDERLLGHRFGLVISNPPFRLWQEFVEAMRPLVAPGGMMLVLGFANLLGGQARAAWWSNWWHRPARVLVSPRRPSFTPDGQTDVRDACWFVWGSAPATETRLDWLVTP